MSWFSWSNWSSNFLKYRGIFFLICLKQYHDPVDDGCKVLSTLRVFRSFDWLNKLDLLGTIELVDGNVIDPRIGVTCLERVKLFVEFLFRRKEILYLYYSNLDLL